MKFLQVVDNKSAKVNQASEMTALQHVQLYKEENQRKTTCQVTVERLGSCFFGCPEAKL